MQASESRLLSEFRTLRHRYDESPETFRDFYQTQDCDIRGAISLDDAGAPVLTAFAWPGGYTLIYLTDDGDILDATCASEYIDDVVGYDTYDEGPTIFCDNCGRSIESSYGDPESSDEEE